LCGWLNVCVCMPREIFFQQSKKIFYFISWSKELARYTYTR
jgi:hypothetical protein